MKFASKAKILDTKKGKLILPLFAIQKFAIL